MVLPKGGVRGETQCLVNHVPRVIPHNRTHFSRNNKSIYAVIINLNFSRVMYCKNEKDGKNEGTCVESVSWMVGCWVRD